MLEAALTFVGSPVGAYHVKQQQICPGDLYIFHQSLFFLFPFFAAPLGYLDTFGSTVAVS